MSLANMQNALFQVQRARDGVGLCISRRKPIQQKTAERIKREISKTRRALDQLEEMLDKAPIQRNQ